MFIIAPKIRMSTPRNPEFSLAQIVKKNKKKVTKKTQLGSILGSIKKPIGL